MPRYSPSQIVDDLVYVDSDNSPNLEDYYDPALANNDLNLQESAITKS